MLRTDPLTLTAGNTVGSFAVMSGVDSVIEAAAPILVFPAGVQTGKQVGNLNVHGTSRRTVAAGRAGNSV